MRSDGADPFDVPGFDRAIGVDDPVPDAEYGDRNYRPEREVADGGQEPVDGLHESLLKVEREVRALEKRLPEPLTLSDSIRELSATAAAYARLDVDRRETSG